MSLPIAPPPSSGFGGHNSAHAEGGNGVSVGTAVAGIDDAWAESGTAGVEVVVWSVPDVAGGVYDVGCSMPEDDAEGLNINDMLINASTEATTLVAHLT
eukprot:381913-Ditylum_brightwellii.AAC.1